MFEEAPHSAPSPTYEPISDTPEPDMPPPTPLSKTQGGYDMPQWIWTAMFTCYGIFFATIMVATGRDGEAIFVIIISILYALFYFGTASVLGALQGPHKESPLNQGKGVMETWTGPMSHSAVAAQILGVPLALALFGVLFAIIRAVVAP